MDFAGFKLPLLDRRACGCAEPGIGRANHGRTMDPTIRANDEIDNRHAFDTGLAKVCRIHRRDLSNRDRLNGDVGEIDWGLVEGIAPRWGSMGMIGEGDRAGGFSRSAAGEQCRYRKKRGRAKHDRSKYRGWR